MLYNIFIQPLVIILRSIYLCINYFAGDLGISLMILSVVMNILLRPFTLWASRIQDKERKIQNILSPQIAEIKQNFHGVEQHEELSALYQRYSYNPIYAIRSGLDLFVQLLPLMAAYIMLSELDILKGVSFFGIKDLSKPDALLAGINLLPILMTFFNVLATLTTRKFTKRERVQAFVIAALFLVMLYNAPSALLIYWTTNNFIMLLKNIDISGIISGDKISGFMNYRFEAEGWKKIFINVLMTIISLGILGSYLVYFYRTFVNKYYWQLATVEIFNNIYYLLFMIVFIFVWMLFVKFIIGGFRIRELIIKSICFAACTCGILFYMKYVMIPPKVFIHVFTFLSMLFGYALLAFLLTVNEENFSSIVSRLTNDHPQSLFFSSVVFIVIFLCVFFPSLLYLTDPNFFLDSFLGTVSGVSIYGMTLLFALILVWPLLPRFMQNLLAFIAAFLVCMAFINSFVLTENYGNINNMQLDDNKMTMSRSLIRDIISFSITLIIMIICVWKKYIKHLIAAFVLISFAMCGVSVYCYLNINHNNVSQISENKSDLPEYHNRLWRFSKTGKNVICLFLDGFTGDHVIKILAEHPDLVKKFDGFTYFPDNMSTGSWTFFSTPAIYGGPAYEPATLNKRPDVSIADKYAEAFSFLPNIFTNKGYDVALTAPFRLSPDDSNFTNRLNHPESVLALPMTWQEDYIDHWLNWAQKNNLPIAMKDSEDISKFLLVLSLFRSMPFSIRSSLYNKGHWTLGVSNQVLKMTLSKSFLPNIATIQHMGEFIKVDEGESTFKVIYNHLSHPPCFLEPDSFQPVLDPYPEIESQSTLVNGLLPEHYFTEVHIMYFIADFIAALKNAGIYDNTRIVLVSDHDFADCWQLNTNPNWKFLRNWPNALLMFKDFDAHGDLITSDSLMSIEDTPALLIAGIARHEGIYTLEELKKLSSSDRIRIHCGHSTLIETPKLFSLDGGLFQVKGTMFKPENWTRIE